MDARPPIHGRATDYPRTYHGRTSGRLRTSHGLIRAPDGLHTGNGHAGAPACAPFGLPSARFPPKQASAVHFVTLPRTSDGWTMGGHRSDLDESSDPKMGGGVADEARPPVSRVQQPCIHACRTGGNGRDVRCPSCAATGGTRTHNGLLTDCTRTWLRTSDFMGEKVCPFS